MRREELEKRLIIATELEESYIPVLAKFFLDEFDWSGIDEGKAEKVKRLLKVIEAQTLQHDRTIDEILAFIKESGDDEF